jgi:3,4-dihydroxy 2-butanone 4-phosphate synthase/GTP cyclohydrolase II
MMGATPLPVELSSRHGRPVRETTFSPIEKIVDDTRNGRMVIVFDDNHRNPVGYLVQAAQLVTPETVNFMARQARGLICLAMTAKRAEQLSIPMLPNNRSGDRLAFTVSIEARFGVTTGISAADRARTIAVAIDSFHNADSIVTPGHVFPIVAAAGGVLNSPGHAEAAVDIATLAGVNPSGVVCAIMSENGAIAGEAEIVEVSEEHGLSLCSIRDLIAFRERRDRNLVCRLERRFDCIDQNGWTARHYVDSSVGSSYLALSLGNVDSAFPTPVRIHSLSIFRDAIGEVSPQTGLLATAMHRLVEMGSGVIILATTDAEFPPSANRFPAAANEIDKRSSPPGGTVIAQILSDLGIEKIALLRHRSDPANAHHHWMSAIVSETLLSAESDATPDNRRLIS